MKYFERLSPVDRKRLVLDMAAFDAAMEGMHVAKTDCVEALRALDREQIVAVTAQPSDQKVR